MLYEYRRYEVNPGKKPELDARFKDLTLPLWEKHGMKAVGMFDVEVGTMTNEFHYILAWDSLADREKKWSGFFSDKERLAKFAETEKNGPLVRNLTAHILRPTAYSPMQ